MKMKNKTENEKQKINKKKRSTDTKPARTYGKPVGMF
jgi:hypothetical protein